MTWAKFSLPLLSLTVFFLLCMFFRRADCLQCYACPETEREGLYNANIQCLSNGYEVECDVSESRCYSKSASGKSIEKGCIGREFCNGSYDNICCGTDYCNAGYSLYPQTGYGKECFNPADCVQGVIAMECRHKTAEDTTKICACLPNYQNRNAVCFSAGGKQYLLCSSLKIQGAILLVYTVLTTFVRK